MAASKKPAKAKSKAPLKTVKTGKPQPGRPKPGKPKVLKPAAKKAAPLKRPVAAKKPATAKKPAAAQKPVTAKKPVAAKKPISAAKPATPAKKPVPAAKPVRAVKPAPVKTVATVPAAKKAVASATAKPAAVKPKAALVRKPAVAPQRPAIPEIIPPLPEVGRDYMNPGQREFYRKLLLSQRGDLTAELEQTIHHMQDENVNLPDPNDRASQEADMTLELRSRDRETKLIHKIDEAIARLEAGEYGFCESCGEPIGRGRLEARPTATLCIDCKRLDEIRERQVA